MDITFVNPHVTEHPFWKFSVAVYEQPGAQQSLLTLQDAHHLNVNLMLFCCWVAYNKQGRLVKKDIQELLAATHVWHEDLVVTLREMRNGIKEIAASSVKYKRVRQAVLDTELMAEKIEQLLLIDNIIKPPYKVRSASQQLIDAARNLLMYCKALKVNLDITDCRNFVEVLAAVFPQFGKAEIIDQLQRILQQEDPSLHQLSHQLRLGI